MFAYLEGLAVGQELDDKIKSYKSVSYTSHRRVGMIDFCDNKLLRRNILYIQFVLSYYYELSGTRVGVDISNHRKFSLLAYM